MAQMYERRPGGGGAASVLADGHRDHSTAGARGEAARDLFRGRERELAAAVGVELPTGKGHVTCPFPDHGGAADFRWDPAKCAFFCTCGPGDIIALVARMKGISPAEAIRFCRQVLGLVEDRPDRARFIRGTTAEALLNAPAELRDGPLVRSYLAARLGIEPAAVLLPSTRVIGIAALDYWDAPATNQAKPFKVGTYPAVVFEQVGPDGQRHALRVYLAPGGAGKAELGMGPNGKPRNLKKSAVAAAGDNTSGRAAIWGSTSAP